MGIQRQAGTPVYIPPACLRGQSEGITRRPDIDSSLFIFSEEVCLLPEWLPGA